MSDISSRKLIYQKVNGRLAQFKEWTNTAEDWDNIWIGSNIRKILNDKITDLGELNLIRNYLPRKAKILEAGCGTGWVVQALSLCGYDIEGIDYAENSIALINQIAPELNVRYGNVLSIDVPDNTFGAYISLGVLEHNIKGPSQGLQEAYRVLQSGGYGFFTVPYLNKTRKKMLSKIRENTDDKNYKNFYQYYFSQSEFSLFLEQAGFEIVDVIPIGLYFGLKDDSLLFSLLADKKFFYWRLNRFVINSCKSASTYFRWLFGHMLLFVAKKTITELSPSIHSTPKGE